MAADLRFIVAALKINTDLERMGDLAKSMAQQALTLMQGPAIKPDIDIPLIATLVQSMVRNALDSFVRRNAELARSVLVADDEVDSLRNACFGELKTFLERRPQNIHEGLALLVVTRNLERIADHATNVAEDVLFLVNGVDVRHHSEAV